MPTFIFDNEKVIKAEVSSAYLFEKEARGTIHLRWFAKKVRTISGNIKHFPQDNTVCVFVFALDNGADK